MRNDEIECREYEKLVKEYVDMQLEFDLDDVASVSIEKFEQTLAQIK